MEKKYRLTDETREYLGITLHRIQALNDFGDVEAGDLGGWIESKKNLSQYGDCWVYDGAMVCKDAEIYENAAIRDSGIVYGNAKVYENAQVYDNAMVYDNALVYENVEIRDNARVYGNALVYGNAEIRDNARVYGNTEVMDNAKVYGNAEVFGYAQVYGNAEVCKNAELNENARVRRNAYIKEKRDILYISPIGSRNGSVTFYKTKDGIYVTCACFNGSIDSFEKSVQETHGDNEYAEQYKVAIQLAKTSIR